VEQQVAAAEADAGPVEQLHDADGLAVDQYGVVGVAVTQEHPAAWGDRNSAWPGDTVLSVRTRLAVGLRPTRWVPTVSW